MSVSSSRWSALGTVLVCRLVAPLGAQAQAPTHAPTHAPALDRANLDTTCAACTDFFQFANGGWLKRTTIPAVYPQYGSFRELLDRNEAVLHTLLDRDAAAAAAGQLTPGTGSWKIGTYYASCMDTVGRDKLGLSPLKAEFDLIAAIRTRDDLVRALGVLEHRAGLAPWSDGSTQDAKDAVSVIAYLGQGGLTLPDRDYYVQTDSASRAIVDHYRQHLVAMLTLAGDAPDRARAEAQTVLAFETTLAAASKTRVELRDPQANYHKMTVGALETRLPHVPWRAFFAAQGASSVSAVDLQQPAFFTTVDSLVAHASLDDWRVLMRWRALHAAAPALGSPFVAENFTFSQLFSGAPSNLELWKRCIASTDNRLGELLGQEYVKETFTPEAKARAVRIVSNLVTELHERISHLTWMSAPTKARAETKLAAFARKIGYPDKWKDYTAVTITPGTYVANIRAAEQWASVRDWSKVGKPLDRTEWGMTPPTVNAYYNPLMNEIVFPAGILQPPFYDPTADDAVNYGAMGAVIGHEMTHGFDDQGRQYDEHGNLADWWTADDAAKFKTEAHKISTQFSTYTVLDSATHVDGELTLGENIADFGGLTTAYSAMEKALGNGPHPAIDGFTPEQRFFLAWAEVWRELDRPAYARQLVKLDYHAPAKWRVNGPFGNMPEFKAAWGCKDSDPMVRPAAEQPRIW
ncbi:MAG TPA: M13 family metallopeptidase [Gemmatimonadaceae bacterium]|nr:M13 family metallopeptidase [Gemmatimonadaceae bacterium]